MTSDGNVILCYCYYLALKRNSFKDRFMRIDIFQLTFTSKKWKLKNHHSICKILFYPLEAFISHSVSQILINVFLNIVMSGSILSVLCINFNISRSRWAIWLKRVPTTKFPFTSKSSHPEVFLGKGVPKICSKFTGEHPCRSVIENCASFFRK